MVPLRLEWGTLASGTLMSSTEHVPRLENVITVSIFNVQIELKEYWSSYDHSENVPKLSRDRTVILVKETRLYS